MCGIVGVLGKGPVAELLVDALKRLEYRGYDSTGIATVADRGIERRRAEGKLRNLEMLLRSEPLPGNAGIGHTRWATHGKPSEANAHPHMTGDVAVVHNGIIENFRELKAELLAEGAPFTSDTDTEVIAHLITRELRDGKDPIAAVHKTLSHLKGAFALAMIFTGYDDLMIAARQGSPLAIGYGDGEMFVGSDAIALAPMTDRITYLEEGDYAFVTREGAEIFDVSDRRANREAAKIQLDQTRIDKAGYKHFMAKEIAEQPVVLADAIRHYVRGGQIMLPHALDFAALDRLTLVACGTANYACQTAKYWFESLAGLPCEVDIASEFRYREPPLPAKSFALFVSQSGETADTLAALRFAREKVARTVAVINVTTSSIAREADVALPIHAGVEVGVASTKAFTCQLLVLYLLALKAAADRGRLAPEDLAARIADLSALPGLMNQTLAREAEIAEIAAWRCRSAGHPVPGTRDDVPAGA